MNGNRYTNSAILFSIAPNVNGSAQNRKEVPVLKCNELLVLIDVTVMQEVSTGCLYNFSQFNPMTASNFDRLQCIDPFSYQVDVSARNTTLSGIPTVTFCSTKTKTDLVPVVLQPSTINA